MRPRILLAVLTILPTAISVQPATAIDNSVSTVAPLADHPYRFVPAYGHASQIPGSPKFFVPGYGYRIPGFGFRGGHAATLNPYAEFYSFGRRNYALYDDANYRFWRDTNAGPWYHPGWPANTQSMWGSW